jgi:hypothetical protein
MNKAMIKQAEMVLHESKARKVDNELLHAKEDKLKNAFIHHFAAGKLSVAEAFNLAKLLDRVTRAKYQRWYA